MAKVLIVEDSEMLCKIFDDLLKKYTNFDYTIVQTYAEAKKELLQFRYEFAVADMNLPDAKQGEIIALLNKHNIAPIVFTGIFDDDFREGFESANIVDYVLKERYENIVYVVEKLRQLQENKNTTVLVVDDSHTYMNFLKLNLSIHNFKVITASNGVEALEKLELHPDTELMITDYHMPYMDGMELVRRTRKKFSKKDLSIVILTGETNSFTTSKFLKEGANDYITKPFSRDEFYARIYQNIETVELFGAMQKQFDEDIIMLLSEITEFKSAETNLHIKRIREYTYALAKLLGLFDEEAKVISKMSMLHDIGKITVADRILCKPGKLSEKEFAEMQHHTSRGHKLLRQAFASDLKVGEIAMDIALYHHENWDGSGYPHGIAGEAIPLHARIVALVDVFDALMNHRIYKEPWELEETLKYIEDQSEIKFDPKIVKTFLLNIECFTNILQRYGHDELKEGFCKLDNSE